MIKSRPQVTTHELWLDTQADPLTDADAAPPTLALAALRYRQAKAAAESASPIKGLEVSEIDSDTAFDRLFGADPTPAGT